MVEVKWMLQLTRFIVCSLSNSICNRWMDNLRSGGDCRWKVEDRQLGRLESVIWKVDTFNIVAPACVG
jgi:hypothetical protein